MLYGFAGTNKGELPVAAGEMLVLIQDDGSGWAHVSRVCMLSSLCPCVQLIAYRALMSKAMCRHHITNASRVIQDVYSVCWHQTAACSWTALAFEENRNNICHKIEEKHMFHISCSSYLSCSRPPPMLKCSLIFRNKRQGEAERSLRATRS